MKALMIRVEPEDFDSWLQAHRAAGPARLAFGISDGPIYRDLDDVGVCLVQLQVDDVDRAMSWFSSDAFRAASRGVALKGPRQLWVAEAAD